MNFWFRSFSRFQNYAQGIVRKQLLDPQHIQSIIFWGAAIAAGLSSVAFAKLFRWAEHVFMKIVEQSDYAPFVASPILFVLAWYLVKRYAPEAAGSGIPQIMAANEMNTSKKNHELVARLLSLKTAGVKVLSSILCVLGGGAVGREGPTLQISASIFYFYGSLSRRYLPNVSEHTWVVAGAASGLASAFNTPLGGIVYAIEELGLVHFNKVRTALIGGVIVSGLVAQWLLGPYLYLGYPALSPIGFSFMPFALANGIITGLLGALFGRILIYLVNQRFAIRDTRNLALVAAMSGVIMASFIFFNKHAAGTGIELTTHLLFRDDHVSVVTIAIRFWGTIVSYLSGAAGGIFSPSLTVGATAGSLLSEFFGSEHPRLMVLLGMIGFLTGVTRTPFTAFILVLEMTDRHSAIFPMMLSALAANWVSHYVDPHSFYEHMKERYIATAQTGKEHSVVQVSATTTR